MLTDVLLRLGSSARARNTPLSLLLKPDRSDLTSLTACLRQLIAINSHLERIHELALDGEMKGKHEAGELFPVVPDLEEAGVEELSVRVAETDIACFYGKWSGFHFKGWRVLYNIAVPSAEVCVFPGLSPR